MLSAMGAALYASGAYEDAAQRVCAASDLLPADPTPYLFLGQMEQAAPHPLPCVEQKLARFVQDQPANALANYHYALALWKRHQGTESPAGLQTVEASLDKAIAVNPRFDQAYLQLGILYFAQGNLERATGAYQKAIELNPSLSEAHYRLGVAYRRVGNATRAAQEFKAHDQIQKTESAVIDRQRREVRQFVIVLPSQPDTRPN